jgi:DNA-binding transcriptional MerR regulator
MARILADASRRAALLPDATPAGYDETPEVAARGAAAGAGADAGAPVVPDDRVGAHPASESRRQRERASAAAAAGREAAAAREKERARGDATEKQAARPSGSASTSTSTTAQPAATATTPAPRGAGTHAHATAGPPAERAVPRLPAAMVTGASLTLEELCSASGLSPEELAGLESYGLVEATTVAGLRTYDEEALTVANLAASFRAFGIEPRHLRLYRNAADREMGLIEQVVIPLLRQRNPESRQRAADAAEQLATLGQSMRATLLRVALRRHLGG